MRNNLVSSIYSNPNNAGCAYDVTASRAQNQKEIKRADPYRMALAEIEKAVSQLQDGIAPQGDSRAKSIRALHILHQLASSLRQRRDASRQG
jgi:hypothetical protein